MLVKLTRYCGLSFLGVGLLIMSGVALAQVGPPLAIDMACFNTDDHGGGRTDQCTAGGACNLDPHLCPDGMTIALYEDDYVEENFYYCEAVLQSFSCTATGNEAPCLTWTSYKVKFFPHDPLLAHCCLLYTSPSPRDRG